INVDNNIYLDFYRKLLISFSKIEIKENEKNRRNDERVNNVSQLIGKQKISSILDIGAGDGEILKSIKEFYHLNSTNVFAIDQKLPNNSQLDYIPLVYYFNKI